MKCVRTVEKSDEIQLTESKYPTDRVKILQYRFRHPLLLETLTKFRYSRTIYG